MWVLTHTPMLFVISPLHHVAVSVAIGTLDLAISTHTSDSTMHACGGPTLHSSHSKSTSAKSHTTQQPTPEDCILSGDPFLDLFQTFRLCFYHSILWLYVSTRDAGVQFGSQAEPQTFFGVRSGSGTFSCWTWTEPEPFEFNTSVLLSPS